MYCSSCVKCAPRCLHTRIIYFNTGICMGIDDDHESGRESGKIC